MLIKRLKKIICFTVIGILSLTTLLGCGSSSSGSGKIEEKKELNVFNWTEYIPENVVQEFEKEYGIKVNYSTFSSNEECLAKLQSSAEGTYDVVVPSDYMVSIMAQKGLLEKLDKDKLTNFGNVNKVYLDKDFDKGNEYSVPFDTAAGIIAINTDVVKEDIKSYKDLLNPKYINSMVVLDDQRALIGIALKALGYSLNETDDAKLAEAKAFLEKLKPNIKLYDSDSPKSALINGEASIGFTWNAEAALAMAENKNIKVIYPQEGMFMTIDNFAIPKGAKNKETAELFINFILRPEVNKEIVEAFPYKSVNKAAADLLPDSYKNNPASNIPDSEMAKGESVKDLGEATAKFDKIWSEIKQ